MRMFVRTSLCLALAVVIAAPLAAQEKKKKKAQTAQEPAAFRLPDRIQLSAEQKAKMAELKKEFGPKLEALQQRVQDVFTPEQRRARRDARKAAQDAGKKGKVLQTAVENAVQLTPEQQKKLEAAQAELNKLTKEVRAKVEGLLTEAQKAELKSRGKKKAA